MGIKKCWRRTMYISAFLFKSGWLFCSGLITCIYKEISDFAYSECIQIEVLHNIFVSLFVNFTYTFYVLCIIADIFLSYYICKIRGLLINQDSSYPFYIIMSQLRKICSVVRSFVWLVRTYDNSRKIWSNNIKLSFEKFSILLTKEITSTFFKKYINFMRKLSFSLRIDLWFLRNVVYYIKLGVVRNLFLLYF